MAGSLPETLALGRLTAAGSEMSGRLRLRPMRRLAGMLVEEAGEAEVALRFWRDDLGRRLVSGRIRADLVCQCQRCLEPVTLHVDQDVALECLWGESQVGQSASEYEPLVIGDAPVSLSDLIEDELILALPPVAVHGQAEPCPAPAFRSAEPAAGAPGEQDGASQPFAVLERLKRRRD